MKLEINTRLKDSKFNWIEKFYIKATIPKDAGMWVYDKKNKRWKEDQKINLDFEKSYKHVRPINDKTTIDIAIDGYPRQGNTSLRTVLLNIFPQVSISQAMTHRVVLLEQALEKEKTIISPIREPISAISSSVNQVIIELTKYQDDFFLNQKVLNNLIFESLNFYIRHYKFILKNHKKIIIVRFKDITEMYQDLISGNINTNVLALYLKNLFNLYIEQSSLISPIPSTKSEYILSKMSNKKFKKKVKKCKNLYNKTYKLSLDLK